MTDPIIDAHHHIWRVAKVPWLNGSQLPRIFGDYGALRLRQQLSDRKTLDEL